MTNANYSVGDIIYGLDDDDNPVVLQITGIDQDGFLTCIPFGG